jgi:hypothetical protein
MFPCKRREDVIQSTIIYFPVCIYIYVCVCVFVCVCMYIGLYTVCLKKLQSNLYPCSGGRKKTFLYENMLPSPVTAWSKASVSGRSIAGVAGSKPAGDMDVCLFSLMCVVWQRSLRRAVHSPKVVLLSVICLRVIVKHR